MLHKALLITEKYGDILIEADDDGTVSVTASNPQMQSEINTDMHFYRRLVMPVNAAVQIASYLRNNGWPGKIEALTETPPDPSYAKGRVY